MDSSLICIICPVGCRLSVEMKDGKINLIQGNKCRRGAVFAEEELSNPIRTVTTTVRVANGEIPMVPVKTSRPIPKEKIIESLRLLKEVKLEAPIPIGAIVMMDICGTGADIVTTRRVPKK